jgi:hypothetical protein
MDWIQVRGDQKGKEKEGNNYRSQERGTATGAKVADKSPKSTVTFGLTQHDATRYPDLHDVG